MIAKQRWLASLFSCLLCLGTCQAVEPPDQNASAAPTPPVANTGKNTERKLFEFKDGDRLVLLGSAFIERMQSNGYFELELQCAFPDKRISVRNLGWSGDTVWGDARAVFGQRADGFQRVLRDVNLCQPSVILVCYGENEAFAGEAGLHDFRRGFDTLLENLEATGARILVATPRKHENLGKPLPDPTEYNKSLRMYCDVMKDVAKEREHMFLDWFEINTLRSPIIALGLEPIGPGPFTNDFVQRSENGIHLSGFGYYYLAEGFVQSLGGKPFNCQMKISKNVFDVKGAVVTDMKFGQPELAFTEQLNRLPMCDMDPRDRSGFVRGAIHSSSFSNYDLPFGRYELYVDGIKESELKFGDKDDYTSIDLPHSHAKLRTKELLSAIREKDFLFFNRHRPQNETYLFLFRKHEQGNNAVEIPQFDPLIDELDKKIAQLKKPTKQKYELRRVEEK